MKKSSYPISSNIELLYQIPVESSGIKFREFQGILMDLTS